jgi:hypothetical protein
LVDRDGDGIEISTGNDDGHQEIGSKSKIYLEMRMDLDDKD